MLKIPSRFSGNRHLKMYNGPRMILSMILTLSAATCLLANCGKNEKQNSYEYYDVPIKSAVAQLPFTAEVVAAPAPNTYRIYIKWPMNSQVKSYQLERVLQKNETTKIAVGLTNQFTDGPFSYEVDLNYNLYAIKDSEETREKIYTFHVTTPRDLVISGLRDATEVALQLKSGSFYRLFLYPNSVIVTQGATVLLKAHEIYSDHGTIRTFTSDQTASPGQPGRSGGQLRLEFEKAGGILNVVSQGEKGGKGSDGYIVQPFYEHPETRNGGPGTVGGNSGLLTMRIERPTDDLKLNVSVIEGEGGDGGTPTALVPSDLSYMTVPAGHPGSKGPAGIKITECLWIGPVPAPLCYVQGAQQ